MNSVLIFDQSSSRKFIDSYILELSSFLPSHEDFWYEFHEDPDLVLIIVHEEVVDLAWIAHTLLQCDQFPFAGNQQFQLIPGYFFYQTRLEVRASGSQIWLQQKFALLVFQGESWFARFRSSFSGLPVLVRVTKDWAGNKLSSWEW